MYLLQWKMFSNKNWGLRFSRILRDVGRYFASDVSGQHISYKFSRVRSSKKNYSWTFWHRIETSVTSCRPTQHNTHEERRRQMQRSGSLKCRKVIDWKQRVYAIHSRNWTAIGLILPTLVRRCCLVQFVRDLN